MPESPDITSCELMELERAFDEVARSDASRLRERAERLRALDELLSTDPVLSFQGRAAEWIFDDLKEAWICGCFIAVILLSDALARQQLAGQLRLLPGDPSLPEGSLSLDRLASIAAEFDLVSIDLQAELMELHDRAEPYTSTDLQHYSPLAERHLTDAGIATADDNPLATDAWKALTCVVSLLR